MPNPLRIIFAGTPDFASVHLNALLSSKHEVIAVLTQPDRPAGRGNKLTASPVKSLALSHKLPLYQPINFKSMEAQQWVADLKADIMVVVAYGIILPISVLTLPYLGCINVHGSLLPRWRGAAPIQRAIWAGDKETGITIMQMNAGLDTGDILNTIHCPILVNETSKTLYEKLAILGPQVLLETLNNIEDKQRHAEKQNETLATYAQKLSKVEAKIDWSLSAHKLERCIRAFNPWPMSFFSINELPIKVWQAHVSHSSPTLTNEKPGTILEVNKQGIQIVTGDGVLVITQLQLAGKKPAMIQDVLNSRRDWFLPGNQLD